MKIVYRIENKEGNGPYTELNDWQEEYHEIATGRPSPFKDNIDNMQFKEICGFNSIKKLKLWFTKKERKNLRKLGYKIKALYVSKDQIRYGHKQLVFIR